MPVCPRCKVAHLKKERHVCAPELDASRERVDGPGVERLTRDVIALYALPLELLTVHHEGPQWRVVVRNAGQVVFDIAFAGTSTLAELRERLTSELLARV